MSSLPDDPHSETLSREGFYLETRHAEDSRRVDLLESWKEIACFLGREVRTVQLWEKREGLPVHRHFHSQRASVHAYRSQLKAWRQGRSMPRPEPGASTQSALNS